MQSDFDAEIEAKARSTSAHRLRPESLNRLCYAHRQKEVEMDALREYLVGEGVGVGEGEGEGEGEGVGVSEGEGEGKR